MPPPSTRHRVARITAVGNGLLLAQVTAHGRTTFVWHEGRPMATYAEHRYGNATTAEFIALAERLSGRDLGTFFDAWLFEPGKPQKPW